LAVFGTPASATFSGSGNATPAPTPAVVKPKAKALTRAEKLAKALKACRTDIREKRRVGCEKVARKRHGAVRKRTRA
jgi:phosphoribosylpyrophosphate synthetase